MVCHRNEDNIMENEVEIGAETFEALSSSARRDILKRLNARPKTVTELADELDLAKSTTHKHLNKMVEAGLIFKKENSNEFVYYALTDKGRGILRSEKVKIMILLTSTAAAVFGGIFATYMYFSKAGKPINPPAKGGVEIPVNELIIVFLFIIAAITLLYFTLKAWRESKTGSK